MTFYTTWFLSQDHFSVRNWRSIESVLYHHPEAEVVVVSNTLDSSLFLPLLTMGCRVSVEKVQPRKWSESTTLQAWTDRIDEWKHGERFFDHLRDASAFLLLHTTGGAYFELDTIFTNSIAHMQNVIGQDSSTLPGLPSSTVQSGSLAPVVTPPTPLLTTTVMRFEPGSGFVAAMVKEFGERYEGSHASHPRSYGGWIATQVWNETFSLSRSSHEVTVLSPEAFNLLSEENIGNFFVASKRELVANDNEIVLAYSYAVKMWEEHTRNTQLMEGSLAHKLMAQFCLLCEAQLK
jgi:hypothetical protein